jgi:acetyl-CoA carboxylase carboxyltransferase component
MVGSRAERGGIIKDGAKLVNAVANSVVPKITLFVGNSYGAGNYAMCGKAYGARFLYAWPSASIAVMGGEQASKTLLGIQLKNRGEEVSEEEKRAGSPHQASYAAAMNPRYAAARQWVDARSSIRRVRLRGVQPRLPEFEPGARPETRLARRIDRLVERAVVGRRGRARRRRRRGRAGRRAVVET